jgi:hypothetical protein
MSYLDITQNPELLQALLQRARCERAEAMYRLLVLPIKRLLTGRSAPGRVPACGSGAHA